MSEPASIPCGCGDRARLTTGREVYPHRPDLAKKSLYLCACGAYVGCHAGTTTPLGTPADAVVRPLRRAAHAHFDPLWREPTGRFHGRRSAAYAWLRELLAITDKDGAHIACLDAEQCRTLIAACAAWSDT